MGLDLEESRRERSVEMRESLDPPMRERWGGEYDNMEENISDELRKSGKYLSKDKSKSSGRKEHRSRDRDKSKSDILKEMEKEGKDLEKERVSSSNRRKEDRDERGKDKTRNKLREKDADRDKLRDKERDKDRKDQGKERERQREKAVEKYGERGLDKEMVKDKSREKDKDRERTKETEREKEREKHKDRERERERENDMDFSKEAFDREKGKERTRKVKLADQDKERVRARDRSSRKHKDESHDRSKGLEKNDNPRIETDYSRDKHITKEEMDYLDENNSKVLESNKNVEAEAAGSLQPASELEDRISKMREKRLKNKSEGGSEVLAWVDKSRKLEEKRNAEKEKALQLSKIFEEQDNINEGESDDEAAQQHNTENLGGVKILHGLDKVLEGGAVVLTLKDQSILTDGDINQEIDMLENVEMGEQKRRDEAYKAAKKKTGIYDDKFNDELDAEKEILPQYDDPVADEGVTLDASGRFTGEAEKKLEELRKRLQGVSTSNNVQDLNSTGKISTDYYTQEEMLKFKKPKKTKSLRKKKKLDLDALEAEAISAGLGVEDLGSRNDGRRQNLREQQEKSEAEMRSNAYQSAYARADEASKALRQGKTQAMKPEEDDAPEFDDDDDELRKSLERARKLSLKKQDEKEKFGPQVIAQLSTSSANDSTADNQNSGSGEPQENKVVFTEMEEFVWGLQLDEEAQKSESEDVFMDEDVAPSTSDQEKKDEGYWTEVEETMKDETPAQEKEEVVPDVSIHESAVGKGLAGALKLLKDRGTLKETVEWGGRNTDKKKSKLVGIYDDDNVKEIRIERTDEYGRILTPKEAFRLISHKFHGKGPGKTKQEKRMRQYQEELKIKQMKNADTPSLSVERMREAQAQLKTPYLVLSGHVKPGQTSDPRSSFATVEKDLTGGLTPMLGDKKVEHFLNIKRKSEPEDSVSHKKPKT